MTASFDSESPKPILRVKVAHFVDAQGDQPAGVRVVEPPADTRQALRGNIYTVIELTGDNPARHDLSERMLSAIQRTYYTAKGGQSQVLHQAVANARQKAIEFNQLHGDDPLEAGIICVGLVQTRLMILHSGPALALITSGSSIERYPADILNFGRVDAEAEPEFYRQDISSGGSLFIGGAGWLDEVPLRTLAATVAYVGIENCTAAAFGLRDQYALADLPGLIIVVESNYPDGVSVSPQTIPPEGTPPTRPTPDVTPQSAPPERPVAPGGLPTSVNTTPPVRSVPTDDSPDFGAYAARGAAALAATGAVMDAADRHEEVPSGEPHAAASNEERPTVADVGERTNAGAGEVASSIAAGAQAGVQKARSLVTNILPTRQPSDRTEIDEFDRHVDELDGYADAPATSSHFEQTLAEVQEESFAPPPPARGGRARLFMLLTVLILALVPIVVAAVYWRKGANQNAETETLIELAEAHLSSAIEALNLDDKVTGRAELSKAQDSLADAKAMRGPSERIDELNVQIQRELQEVLQVRTLQGLVEPLVRFPADALPHRVLVVDQDIYVLDTGRQVVERYQMDNTREFVPDSKPEVILREGAVIDGVTVGRLVDFAWQPPAPGYEDKANLVVLDRNNQFFRYNARVDGASHIQLGDPVALQIANNFDIYNGRTYVADEGAQQILRYDLGGFGQSPDPWFSEQSAANLAGLLSMTIDGDIWLLYSNGMLLRYASGEQVPFSLEGGVGQVDEPVDMALGFDNDASIYIADAAHDRIMVFDKNGSYVAQLTAPESGQLRNLRGLYIDEFAGALYILTQSSLFQHPLPN